MFIDLKTNKPYQKSVSVGILKICGSQTLIPCKDKNGVECLYDTENGRPIYMEELSKMNFKLEV